MEQDYKLIHTQDGDTLYNITKDPAERNDLAETLPKVRIDMKRELMLWKNAVLKELRAVEQLGNI